MSKLELLLKKIQKPEETKHPPPPPKTSRKLMMMLNRLNTREWLHIVEGQLMEGIVYLRREVKFIGHLPHCWMCQMELKLDVERYLGNHSFWWLCLENNEYLERQYRSCPKERNYHIGNYWEQVQYYRDHGTCDVPEENTIQFILDRAKWAYKIAGKQIRLSRQLLRLVRTWSFSDQNIEDYNRIYDELGMYEIANPSFF